MDTPTTFIIHKQPLVEEWLGLSGHFSLLLFCFNWLV